MKNNTKSSITLPPEELELVVGLMKKLGAKSKVEVIRRGLRLLSEKTERASLRQRYRTASLQVREQSADYEALDRLSDEMLGDSVDE